VIAVDWRLEPKFDETMSCHLWAIVRVLTWYGVADPAPLYGCACTFAADLGGPLPDVAFWPPDWIPAAERIFGMKLGEVDRDDFARGWAEVVGRLGAGHPTIIIANVYHLPHTIHFGRSNFGHCVTVVGYDEARREAHLVDNGVACWGGTIPMDQLEQACDLRQLPNGRDARLRYFDLLPPTRPVTIDAVAAADAAAVILAIQRGIAGTDPIYDAHPGHRRRGAAGIAALAASLAELAAALGAGVGQGAPGQAAPGREPLRDEATRDCFSRLCLATYAVGELRLGAGRFIKALLDQGRLAAAQDAAQTAVDCLAESNRLWRLTSMMYLKALAWDGASIAARIAGRLHEIAGLEERAGALLPQAAAAVCQDQ